MRADSVPAATDVDNFGICLSCTLIDCDDGNPECPLSTKVYAAQIRYSKTPKGRAANRRGAKAYYERNKEKVRAKQREYRLYRG